jgi:hypothetical protein
MIHGDERIEKGRGEGCVRTECHLLYIRSAGGGLDLKCMWHHFNSLPITPFLCFISLSFLLGGILERREDIMR